MLKLALDIWRMVRRRSIGGSDAAHTIVSITNSGGFCLITTAAANGLNSTDTISVSGNSVAGYNTTHAINQTPTTTTLETDIPYTSNGTGGTWALSGI